MVRWIARMSSNSRWIWGPLFVVGADEERARPAYSDGVDRLSRNAVLVRIPRAGRSFEEPGALGAAVEHTVGWLGRLDARKRDADSFDA